MAITIGVRILGPASGFIVGSFCTRWYVNFSNPGFDASDPRWIGAWWLGPVGIGTLMLLSSIAMFSFPRELRGKKPPPAAPSAAEGEKVAETPAEPEEKPRLKGMFCNLFESKKSVRLKHVFIEKFEVQTCLHRKV